MSYEDLLVQRCTVIHIGDAGTDRYNNPIRGETSRDTDVHCRIEQLSEDELTVQRDTAGATHHGYFLKDQALGPFDQIEADDVLYEIVGPPYVVYANSSPHHIRARLRSLTDWAVYP